MKEKEKENEDMTNIWCFLLNAFTKGSGNVRTPGCVSFMFNKKGQSVAAKEDFERD